MFRTEIRFNGGRESLADVISAGIIEEFFGTSKKDVVERSKVLKVIDDYHAKIIENMFKDIEHFDANKAFTIAKRRSDLEKLINKIERAE